MSQHKDSQGFITFAQNTNQVDYLKLAYVQCMSIKLTQKINKYAVIVDKKTESQIEQHHREMFDYIIVLDHDTTTDVARFNNEWQVFNLTPFKETIKLESDLLFTRSIDHWWNTFRLRDIVLSSGCKNYQGLNSTVRFYRKLFDDNGLPDVYNGLMYFRYTKNAHDFFNTAKQIFEEYPAVRDNALLNCRESYPSSDVVYAVVASIIGEEHCTLPAADFINFVHMKPQINNNRHERWQDDFITELDQGMIRVNMYNQYDPFHYYDKTYITEEIINEYRTRCSKILG